MKKRNFILFFILGTLMILIGISIGLFFTTISKNILYAIYLVAAIIYLLVLLFLRIKFRVYNTYYQYLLMIKNKNEPYSLNRKLYTSKWLGDVKNLEYKLEEDNFDYQIYSKYIKKSRRPYLVSQTLVFLIIAKRSNLDFYSQKLELATQQIDFGKLKVRRKIVLQFKRYNELNDNNINDIEQIININEGQSHIIHLTAGYFNNEDKLYFLEPKKKYPSKYYYFSCELIKELAGIKEVHNEQKQESKQV